MSEPPLDYDDSGPPAPERRGSIGWLLVLVAIVAVVVLANRPHEAPTAATDTPPSATPTAAATTSPPPSLPPPAGMGAAFPDVNGTAAALTIAGTDVYVAQQDPSAVMRLDPSGKVVLMLGSSPPDPTGIAVDVATDRLWVWSNNVVRSYQSWSLKQTGQADIGGQIFSAAAYDGFLWVGTERGLIRVAADGQQHPVLAVGRSGVYSAVADPRRERLYLAAVPTERTQILAYEPAHDRVAAETSVALGKVSLAVVGDALWVGGYGDAEHVQRFDPWTLRPLPGHIPVADEVGPGAVVSAGEQSVWVHDGGSMQVFCVAAGSGFALQAWPNVQGNPVSRLGSAYAISDGVRPLQLRGGCRG